MTTIKQILSKLENVKPTGENKWTARCPAHPDTNNSLSIGLGRTGQPLFKCFAMCSYKQIAESLGLLQNSKRKRFDDYPPAPPDALRRFWKAKDLPGQPDFLTDRDVRLAKLKQGEQLRFLGYEQPNSPPCGCIRAMADGSLVQTQYGAEKYPNLGNAGLHGLHNLNGADEVPFVEGLKDYLTARSLGFAAVSGGAGAGTFKPQWADHFKGKQVSIIYDLDDAGRNGSKKAATALYGIAAEVRIVTLPGSVKGYDLSDYVQDGHTAEDIRRLMEQAEVFAPDPEDDTEERPVGKKTNTQKLLEIAAECKLIASLDNRVFIQPPGRRPLEIQSRGGGARAWLRAEFFRRYNRPVRDGDLSMVSDTMAAMAMDIPKVNVYTRIRADKEQIVIDLGWDNNDAIIIGGGDLPRIEQSHDVLFVRTDGATAPMPRPNFEANKRDVFHAFYDLMGLSREDSFKLICWLIQCWQPAAPYLILFLTGGAGCGKSTTTGFVRYIVDPMGEGGIRFSKSPKDSSDLIAFSTCCHILAVDNVSYINRDLSDTIAGLATGMGNFTRRLYTNADIHCVVRMMPQIINGLSPNGLMPDVKDRMLHVSLKQRREIMPAAEWWECAKSLAPDLVGVLCQACAYALEHLPDQPPTSEFRMADACRWVAAAQPFLIDGTIWEGLDFASLYRETRQADAETLLDEDPLLHQLVGLIREHGSVSGTASAILQQVEAKAHQNGELDALVRSGQWPKNARAFALKLTVYEPILRDGGIGHTERPHRREHTYFTNEASEYNDTPISENEIIPV